jgi:hypothetical protein
LHHPDRGPVLWLLVASAVVRLSSSSQLPQSAASILGAEKDFKIGANKDCEALNPVIALDRQ